MSIKKSTITDLPVDLQGIRKILKTTVQLHALDSIIDNARKGTFHDFKSKLVTPKITLLSQLALLLPASKNIIIDVKAGVYDEPMSV